MDAVRVPQHLELEDVIAWGLGPVDLLCVVSGALVGWWLYLALPGESGVRVIAAMPPAFAGLVLGVLRFGDLALREWVGIAVAYALRARVITTGDLS
jgi:hypothetical protein